MSMFHLCRHQFFPTEKGGESLIVTPADLGCYSCGHGALVQYWHSPTVLPLNRLRQHFNMLFDLIVIGLNSSYRASGDYVLQ